MISCKTERKMNSNELPTGDLDPWRFVRETARSCTNLVDRLHQFNEMLSASDAYPWLDENAKSSILQNIDRVIGLLSNAESLLDVELESFEESFYEQSDEEPFE
jgi:hypothetical protein